MVLICLIIMFQIVEYTHLENYQYKKFIQIMISKYSYKEFSANLNEKKRQPPNKFGHMLPKYTTT